MKRLGWLVMAAVLLALPVAGQAADGYVTGNVNLRAGPDVEYPLIATIPAGTRIAVQGCVQGWEWCDVIAYGNRGWVAGNFIQYDYQDQRVLLPTYGARIGIPIVSFVIGSYWDSYYRNRPFYRQRQSWYRRPVPHRPPPRPIARPPMHRPRPPVNHAPPRPRPPGSHAPRPQPQRPATRPHSQPPTTLRPQVRPAPGGHRPPVQPPRGQPGKEPQGRPKPRPAQNQGGGH